MTNYEKVHKAIIEAVPEIMELKFGCEVKPKMKFEFPQYMFANKFIFITHSGGGQIADTGDYEDYTLQLFEPETGEVYVGLKEVPTITVDLTDRFIEEDFEILGREIRLSDVLRAIEKKHYGYEYSIATDGHLFKLKYGTELGLLTYEGTGIYWDLSHDSLSWHADNRPEVIDFLAEILNL